MLPCSVRFLQCVAVIAPNDTTAFGSLVTGGYSEEQNDINVLTVDRFGNNCTCESEYQPVVTVIYEKDDKKEVVGMSCDEGLWNGKYFVSESGEYDVEIVVMGVTVHAPGGGSQWVVEFVDRDSSVPRYVWAIIIALVAVLLLSGTVLGLVFFMWARGRARSFFNKRLEIPDFGAKQLTLEGIIQDPAIKQIPWHELQLFEKVGAGGGGVCTPHRSHPSSAARADPRPRRHSAPRWSA